jgi:D-aminoacyl-tRNA deacylase
MRALVQRVTEASVTSDGTLVGEIGPGLCVLVGVTHDDSMEQVAKMASKITSLRIFDDDNGVMNRSLTDVGGEVLVVSQFTLYGDTRKGRRPSYVAAAQPDIAEPLIDAMIGTLRGMGATVATGVFKTHMKVSLVNDGPVTLMLEIDAA